MSEPLRMGIIGLGKQGGIRAGTVREHATPCSSRAPTPHRRRPGFEDLRLLPDYGAVLESGVDAVFVCTPNRFIPEVVVRGARRRQARLLREAAGPHRGRRRAHHRGRAAQPRPVLKFGFNHRYHFGIMEAKKIVESGKYGRVLWLRGVYGKAEYSGLPHGLAQRPRPGRRRHPPRPGHPHARPLPPLLRRVHRGQEHVLRTPADELRSRTTPSPCCAPTTAASR